MLPFTSPIKMYAPDGFAAGEDSFTGTASMRPAPVIGELVAEGAPDRVIGDKELGELISNAYRQLGRKQNVLFVPPDGTRPDAHASFVLRHALQHFGDAISEIVPALGTHKKMSQKSIKAFFGKEAPVKKFAKHDWENETSLAGIVPADLVKEFSNGLVERDFPVYVNRRVLDSSHDLIIAPTHIVPHEVMGFAGYSKHIIIGLGGQKTIDMSHEIAALFGIDETLGRMTTPSRQILNYAHANFLGDKNIVYVMLVRSPAANHEKKSADSHGMVTRGVFIGSGDDLFKKAVTLSRQVNVTVIEPLKEAVVYLPPKNYHAFWLAMKGCYRMRLAMQEGGTLHVVCPGVKQFGEKQIQTRIIEKYGYSGWDQLKKFYDNTPKLKKNAGSWAHLTHGSPPEIAPGVPKFKLIVYPSLSSAAVSKERVEAANLNWGNHREIMRRYRFSPNMPVGFHEIDGHKVYWGGNPSKGLWCSKEAFEKLDLI